MNLPGTLLGERAAALPQKVASRGVRVQSSPRLPIHLNPWDSNEPNYRSR